jgi:hypothetical protein
MHADDFPTIDFPTTGMAAIAGAYLWVVDDFISRARRLDFAPSDVGRAASDDCCSDGICLRGDRTTTRSICRLCPGRLSVDNPECNAMLRPLANKKLNIDDTADEASDDIVKLQGINLIEQLLNG